VIHLWDLFDEIKKHENAGLVGCESRLIISSRAHLGQYNILLLLLLISESQRYCNLMCMLTVDKTEPTHERKSAQQSKQY